MVCARLRPAGRGRARRKASGRRGVSLGTDQEQREHDPPARIGVDRERTRHLRVQRPVIDEHFLEEPPDLAILGRLELALEAQDLSPGDGVRLGKKGVDRSESARRTQRARDPLPFGLCVR
jgi:hypothetical protein